jgi:hypothetical protein
MPKIPDEYTAAGHPFYVLVVCDDSCGDDTGESIVWEHQFPAGVTLSAVMRQQVRLAGRYGSSYIAECRIIPESRRDPVVLPGRQSAGSGPITAAVTIPGNQP